MSHYYVGVGDDLKKAEMEAAKLRAQLAAQQAAAGGGSAPIGAGSDAGGMDTTTMLVIGAVAAAVGWSIWKKKKGG